MIVTRKKFLDPLPSTNGFSHNSELILKVQMVCYCFRRPAVCDWCSTAIQVFLSMPFVPFQESIDWCYAVSLNCIEGLWKIVQILPKGLVLYSP